MGDSRVVAAFDLDGTLTEGGSVFRWLRRVAGDREAYEAALRLAGPLALGAALSGAAADRAKERLFRALLAGRDAEVVAATSRAFALDHLAGRPRPVVLARLAWHHAQDHEVVVVSASPEIYMAVIAAQLDAGAVGTRLEVDGRGHLTGNYEGANCRGAEKLRRVREWIAASGEGTPELYAYGNSRGDRRLLGASDHPYDVGRLGRLGALRHFPRLPVAAPTTGG